MIRDLSSGLERPPIVMREVTDPEELARARAQDERYQRNWAWLETHVPAVYEANRGKVICISGEELFSADTAVEAVALAKAAHPDDDGRFTLYVHREKRVRIYAARR